MSSRVLNTKRNIISSYILMIFQLVFQFISKTLIVYTLGEQYLGLSSLFSSILMVLNVAELGFTTSIVYFMYKPLADNDTDKVCALLSYLRSVYKIVGGIMLIIGLGAGFLLPWLIKGDVPTNINIYFLYLLYLINTVISYFLAAHKSALLTAVQRLDLTKISSIVVIIIQYTLQIISLVVFKNYYYFIISMIIGTALTNIFAALISKKKFPQYECRGNLEESDKKNIIKKISGLLICNISIVTYTTLDSIILSAFVGLTMVAIYSNYMTIYRAVNQLIVLVRSAMQSSVGNSVAKDSVEKNLSDLHLWQFLFFFISTICASCLLCLYQPFMEFWMGNKLLLPIYDVILIVIWFFIDISQQPHLLYLSGAGLWNEMKMSYIFNTCCNLILNIVLGKYFGITGVLIASLVTCIISGVFWQCTIIFHKYFNQSSKKYIFAQFKYFLIATIIVGVCYLVSSYINLPGFGGIVLKLFACLTLSTILVLFFSIKNKNFKSALNLFKRVIKRR